VFLLWSGWGNIYVTVAYGADLSSVDIVMMFGWCLVLLWVLLCNENNAVMFLLCDGRGWCFLDDLVKGSLRDKLSDHRHVGTFSQTRTNAATCHDRVLVAAVFDGKGSTGLIQFSPRGTAWGQNERHFRDYQIFVS
jgi:hypothetical protein